MKMNKVKLMGLFGSSKERNQCNLDSWISIIAIMNLALLLLGKKIHILKVIAQYLNFPHRIVFTFFF